MAGFRLEVAAGALLLAAGVFFHGAGATVRETAWWNAVPRDVDRHPERLWDWRDPQFLAWSRPRPAPEADATDESDTLPPP